MVRTFTLIADALEAKAADEIVSGIWFKKAKPTTRKELLESPPDVVFLATADADDDMMRCLAYEAQHGEPMDERDRRYINDLAKQAS